MNRVYNFDKEDDYTDSDDENVYNEENSYINNMIGGYRDEKTSDYVDSTFQKLVKDIKHSAYNSIIMQYPETDSASQNVELEEKYCKYLMKLYEIYKKTLESEPTDTTIQELRNEMHNTMKLHNINANKQENANELFDYIVNFSKKIHNNVSSFSDRLPYLNHIDTQFKTYPYPYNSENSA